MLKVAYSEWATGSSCSWKKDLQGPVCGRRGHLTEGMVRNRFSNSIQTFFLGKVLGLGEQAAVECWSGAPVAGQEE